MPTKSLAGYLFVLGTLVAVACSENGSFGLGPPRSPLLDAGVDSLQCVAFGGCREPTQDELNDALAAVGMVVPEGECAFLRSTMQDKIDRGALKIIPQASNGDILGAWGPTDGHIYIREDKARIATGLAAVFGHEGAHDMGYGLEQPTVDWLWDNKGHAYTVQEDSRAGELANSCFR